MAGGFDWTGACSSARAFVLLSRRWLLICRGRGPADESFLGLGLGALHSFVAALALPLCGLVCVLHFWSGVRVKYPLLLFKRYRGGLERVLQIFCLVLRLQGFIDDVFSRQLLLQVVVFAGRVLCKVLSWFPAVGDGLRLV